MAGAASVLRFKGKGCGGSALRLCLFRVFCPPTGGLGFTVCGLGSGAQGFGFRTPKSSFS